MDFVDHKTINALKEDPKDGEVFIKSNLSYFEKNFTKAELYLLIECSYYCEDFSIFKSIDYLTKIDERFSIPPTSNVVAATPKCTCYYSLYCELSGGGGTCETKNVTCTTNANCGLMGTSNCTGLCL